MAVEHNASNERISLEEYFALLEKNPEHGYEYLDGRVYMMTGGTPDHSIIGSNMNGILRDRLRDRPCIVYNSDVYLQLSEQYRVCPDVTVSCDPRDRGAREVIRYPYMLLFLQTLMSKGQQDEFLLYRHCRGKTSFSTR